MPDLHHSIPIAASLDRVAALVSTPEGLREWWAEDVESTPDGKATLGFFTRSTIYRLRPVERTGQRMVWRCETGQEWQDTDLVFTVRPQGSGVVLDFVHANWPEATPYFTSCNTTWGGLMFRLRAAAEGKAPGP